MWRNEQVGIHFGGLPTTQPSDNFPEETSGQLRAKDPISQVKSISELKIDLPWLRVVGAAERLAVVKQEPAIRQI